MRLGASVAVFVAAAVVASHASAAEVPPLVPRQLASLAAESHALVGLDADAPLAVERRLRRAGATRVSSRLRIWRVPSLAARRLVPRLAVSGTLRDVEPDRRHTPTGHISAGDPLLPREWWIERIGANRVEPPGPGRPVAVIDSGLDVTHQEFAGRPNTILMNEQSTVGRREFHGTAVSSIVAAPANAVGLVGVYPSAVLLSWDASTALGILTSDVVAGIEAAAQRAPVVINLSLGGEFRSRFEESAILDAVARGALIVAAAGNERDLGSPPSYPASLPHVLTVAGTGGTDTVTQFSSRIPGIDVAAPAEAIPVAVPTWLRRAGYDFFDGTSFAAPIVAGAAAWIWTARPNLDVTQLTELLRRSARDVGPAGRDADTGFGIIDIPRALELAAPVRDPSEPNDSVEQVRPAMLPGARAAPLTTSRRGSAAVTARLDAVDDPADVYRVWVPALRIVRVSAPAANGVVVGLARSEVTVRARRPARTSPASLELTSRSRRGGYAYVRVTPATGVTETEYRLTVATARARR